MAWDLTIGGVSKKDKIDVSERLVIKLERGERATMDFTTLWSENYVPDRYAPVVAYAKDGTTPIYGGDSMSKQINRLRGGTHVVVGTPGRVMDHLRRGTLEFSALKTVVLDEADEMLRMGFLEDVEWILGQSTGQLQDRKSVV